jgi:hypothetical protein
LEPKDTWVYLDPYRIAARGSRGSELFEGDPEGLRNGRFQRERALLRKTINTVKSLTSWDNYPLDIGE